MLAVVGGMQLTVQVPTHRFGFKRVENHVAAIAAGEARRIGPVRITDDGPVATSQGGCQQFADGGGLTGTGGADKFEVLKLIGW